MLWINEHAIYMAGGSPGRKAIDVREGGQVQNGGVQISTPLETRRDTLMEPFCGPSP
jgi:hypothetical protein